MSSKITQGDSEKDAASLAGNLGIHLEDIPIKRQVRSFQIGINRVKTSINSYWGKPAGKTTTMDNVQARSRAVDLWSIANEWRAVAIATCDKSELYMGYTTIGGDMLGELAPISDVPKEKVRQLARWMNEHRPVKGAIPVNTIEKKSGAELERAPDGHIVTAEEALMPYPFLDEIIWRYEALNQSKTEMMGEKFWYEKHNKLSAKDTEWTTQKKAWLDKFFLLDQTSQIKRELSAPAIIISDRSITKKEYRRPITCKALTWDGSDMAAIEEKLVKA